MNALRIAIALHLALGMVWLIVRREHWMRSFQIGWATGVRWRGGDPEDETKPVLIEILTLLVMAPLDAAIWPVNEVRYQLMLRANRKGN